VFCGCAKRLFAKNFAISNATFNLIFDFQWKANSCQKKVSINGSKAPLLPFFVSFKEVKEKYKKAKLWDAR